jgi:hypothetical protein
VHTVALLILFQIATKRNFTNVAQAANLLMLQSLPFEIKYFHALLYFEVGMLVAFVVEFFNLGGTNIQFGS